MRKKKPWLKGFVSFFTIYTGSNMMNDHFGLSINFWIGYLMCFIGIVLLFSVINGYPDCYNCIKENEGEIKEKIKEKIKEGD